MEPSGGEAGGRWGMCWLEARTLERSRPARANRTLSPAEKLNWTHLPLFLMAMERGGPVESGPAAGPTARPAALRSRGCCRVPKFERDAATPPAGGEPEVAGATGSCTNGAGAGADSFGIPMRRDVFDAFAKTSPSVSRGDLLAAGSGPRQGFGASRRAAAEAVFLSTLLPSGPATQQDRLTLADEMKARPCCSMTAHNPSAGWAAPEEQHAFSSSSEQDSSLSSTERCSSSSSSELSSSARSQNFEPRRRPRCPADGSGESFTVRPSTARAASATQHSSDASGTTTGRQAGASVSRRARGRPPSSPIS
jgi:hypothetical protein